MKRLPILFATLWLTSVVADETSVYESANEVSIGRVFLTPAERNWLDVKRLEPRSDAGTTSSEQSQAENEADRPVTPAGFIIRSNGDQRHWRGGEFVSNTSQSLSAMRFPGEVEITRHGADENDEEPRPDSAVPAEGDHDDSAN